MSAEASLWPSPFPFDSSRTGTGDGCVFLLGPRASNCEAHKNRPFLVMKQKQNTNIYRSQEKYTMRTSGRILRRSVLVNLGKAQENGSQFWQTRSPATILHDSVPADSIEKVVSLQGDNILNQRIPTPRPSSEDIVEQRLAGGARQTLTHREIACGGRPLQNGSPCSSSSTKCST